MAQQLVFSDAADSGDRIELRAEAFVSQRALILDGKAVRLLLDIADEREGRRIAVNAYLVPGTRDQGARSVPVVLYHTENGHAYAELAQ